MHWHGPYLTNIALAPLEQSIIDKLAISLLSGRRDMPYWVNMVGGANTTLVCFNTIWDPSVLAMALIFLCVD